MCLPFREFSALGCINNLEILLFYGVHLLGLMELICGPYSCNHFVVNQLSTRGALLSNWDLLYQVDQAPPPQRPSLTSRQDSTLSPGQTDSQVDASRCKSTQVGGQTKRKLNASPKLAMTCEPVWPGVNTSRASNSFHILYALY